MTNNALTLASQFPLVTHTQAVEAITRIAEGMTITEACEKSYISQASFRSLVKREPVLQNLLDEALQMRDDTLADMLINIDKQGLAPAVMGVVSKNIQWVLERSRPDKFSARTADTNVNNEVNRNLALALAEAVTRIPKHIPGDAAKAIPEAIDVTFTDAKMAPAATPAPSLQGGNAQAEQEAVARAELIRLGVLPQ